MNHPSLSIILPIYNEADNLKPLHQSLANVLDKLLQDYEIILCDDGSTDNSRQIIDEITQNHANTKGLFLKRNFGQTAAISAGIDVAQGEIMILMDADQQNDPEDIPKMLSRLDEGFDIVSGWRKQRKDPWLTKVLPSKIANWIISFITGVRIHDHGCTLKAYRREILSQVALYGEMHRFITIYGHWLGARVGEVEVQHRPRTQGQSKYSISKTFKVLLDLPLLVLLGSYITRPMHFFGSIGLILNFIALLCGLDVAYEKFYQGDDVSANPFLLLTVFFALVGVQIIMIGLLAELISRIYHENQNRRTYVIDKKINFDEHT